MALEFYVKGQKKSEYISHIWEKTNDELVNDYTDCAVELFKAILDEAISFSSASGRNRRINTCCRFYEIFDKILIIMIFQKIIFLKMELIMMLLQ